VKAVIIAGGEGKRIRSVAQIVPKPMLDVGGIPLIERQIRLLRRYGISEIHLTVRARDLAMFRERFGSGESLGVAIAYHAERSPLSTAGGLKPVLGHLGHDFLVLYGDVMVHMDLESLIHFHRSKKAVATLVVHPTDHPLDSDLVEVDEASRIRAFHPKPRPKKMYCRNLGNAAVYVLSQAVMNGIPEGSSDFMRDVFPRALADGAPLYGYRTREYLKDIGTPERLAAVQADWAAGRIERRHRDCALPAIFFDRDGTLCELVPLLHRIEDLRLMPGAAEAVRRVNQADCLAVVVTNQPVVAHGLCTAAEVDRIHARLEMLLGEHGAILDAIYYCPHHPDAGYPGEVADLKVTCKCRKPGSALVRRAARDLNIDLSRSVLVGDSTRDIETGRRLGLPTVLVRTGHGGHDGNFSVRPDAACPTVAEAVDLILSQRDKRNAVASSLRSSQ
jgi:histidinol-phosphate phosphatase family protein